jgi:hypothetical protein
MRSWLANAPFDKAELVACFGEGGRVVWETTLLYHGDNLQRAIDARLGQQSRALCLAATRIQARVRGMSVRKKTFAHSGGGWALGARPDGAPPVRDRRRSNCLRRIQIRGSELRACACALHSGTGLLWQHPVPALGTNTEWFLSLRVRWGAKASGAAACIGRNARRRMPCAKMGHRRTPSVLSCQTNNLIQLFSIGSIKS